MTTRLLLLFLCLMAVRLPAQIPGTVEVTGPIAPRFTNSLYGATLPVYGTGGALTGLGSLSQAQDLNRFPLQRRHSGMPLYLTNGAIYQLGADLTTWTQSVFPVAFSNVAELISCNPTWFPPDSLFVTQGRYSAGDGGGSAFYFDPASTATTNYGTVFPTASTGRFLWAGGDRINVKIFGVVGDYNRQTETGTDNGPMLANIISALTQTNVSLYGNQPQIYFPHAYYLCNTNWRTWTTNHTSSGGDYVRGTVHIVGENQNSTVLVFGGTTNCGIEIGNGASSVIQLSVDSTTARSTNTQSQPFAGAGIVLRDPVDGLGSGFTITDVQVRNQPGYGFVHAGAVEDAVVTRLRVSNCNKGGGFGGIGLIQDFGFGAFSSTYTQVRSELNNGPGLVIDGAYNNVFIDLKLLNNTNAFQGAFTNSIGNLFLNPDIEDFLVTGTTKLAATTGFSYTSTIMSNAGINFVSSGFLAGQFLVVTNSTSNDGVYLITAVATHDVTVSNGIQGFTVGADAATTGVQSTEHGVGLLFYGGYGDQIIGGTFNSLCAGIVSRTPRDQVFWNPRIANYTASMPDMPWGIWLVTDPATQFGNSLKVLETDTPNVVNKWGGRHMLTATNNVIQGGRFVSNITHDGKENFNDLVTIGELTDGRVLLINGGAGGTPPIRIIRTGSDTYDLSPSGNGITFQNVTQGTPAAALIADGTQKQIYGGSTAAVAAPQSFIVRAESASGSDVAAGTLALRAGTPTGAAQPSQISFQLSTVRTSGSTAQTVSTRASLVEPLSPATGDTLFSQQYYDGATWQPAGEKRQTNGVLTIGTYTPLAPIANPTFTGALIAPTIISSSGLGDAIDYMNLTMQAMGGAVVCWIPGASPTTCSSSVTLTDNQARYCAIYLPYDKVLTGITFFQTTQGNFTGDQNNELALFTPSGGTLTRVAITANDPNNWKNASNTEAKIPFTGTYSATRGLYYIGFVYNNSATVQDPVIAAPAAAAITATATMDFTNSNKLQGSVSAQNSLPSTQAASGINVSVSRPLMGLY